MRAIFCMLFSFVFCAACFAFAQPSTPSQGDPGKDGCYLGVFREGAPQNMAFIRSFEKNFKKKPAMVMWYMDYTSDFPAKECADVYSYGAVPHIVWEPWIWGDEGKIDLKSIIRGDWDSHIIRWAKAAKAFNKTVFVRWGHEFNIEKYPWGTGNNGKDPQKYVTAFRHVHDLFKQAGADNIKWIWCFNNYPNPDEAWNSWDLAYPGDDCVDWIGIDGYNWGNTQTWSGWQTFKELFRDQIRDVSKKHPGKPVMIAEFGCAEEGGNKAAWIRTIPDDLKVSMKQVKAIVLFDLRKECDWRTTSCQETENAYRDIFKDPYFLSTYEGITAVTVPIPSPVKKTALARKSQKPIAINGDFTPFSEVTPIVMDNGSFLQEGSGWKGPKDLSASIYLMWDESALYIYAKITDNFPLANSKKDGNIWNGDAIEMTLPRYQVGFGTGDGMANKPSIWIWQKNKPSSGGKIFVKKTADPKGYILEASVPWKELGYLTPKSGQTVDFNIAVDDADETWQRKIQFVWSGDYFFYKDPDVWGLLKFQD